MATDSTKIGLFAYELVHYAVQLEKYSWNSTMLSHYKEITGISGFDMSIGDAVFMIICRNGDLIFDCYQDLDDTSDELETDFACYALNAVPAYFPEGYTPGHCLGFCAMMIGVGLLFLESYEDFTLLRVAADIIQTVLSYFTLISDFHMVEDLPELIRVSRHFWQKLKPREKK